jgi:F-type H+-transporting ATPase subunit gamma
MQANRKLKDEISTNSQLKLLTQAYQEHAITQINLARYSVVASREFMQELAEIFSNVKSSYEIYLKALGSKGKKQLQEKLEKNGREVLILLSSNGKFYGDLVNKVSRLFLEAARNKNVDIVIVGSEGKKLYEVSHINKRFSYFEIPDTNITLEMLKPLIVNIIPYKKATIFYGKFNNIITQEPVESSLTGDMPATQAKEGETNFLFEPSVEKIMEFFESQIFSMLLSQTVNEGKLARFASRIKAMESAQNNLEKQLEALVNRQRRLRSMEINKKQLQLFAGRSLWNKK